MNQAILPRACRGLGAAVLLLIATALVCRTLYLLDAAWRAANFERLMDLVGPAYVDAGEDLTLIRAAMNWHGPLREALTLAVLLVLLLGAYAVFASRLRRQAAPIR